MWKSGMKSDPSEVRDPFRASFYVDDDFKLSC